MVDKRFFTNIGPISIKEVLSKFNLSLHCSEHSNAAEKLIYSVQTLHSAGKNDLSFFHNKKYLQQLQDTKAGFVIIEDKFASFVPKNSLAIISSTPYRAYAEVTSYLYPLASQSESTADTYDNSSVHLGRGVSLGHDVQIGDHSTIGSNTVIGQGVVIGKNCKIAANVTLSHCIIGDSVTIAPGTCIGQPGFGFYMDSKGHVSVPQLGIVVLEDHIDIGANVTIDRGTLEDTRIGFGTRIDNLVQIGHGVTIGRNCVIVSQVGIAGSTKIGDYVVIAGQVGVAGHLCIGDYTQIASRAGVFRDLPNGSKVAGFPAVPIRQWHKQNVKVAKLVNGKTKV